MAPSVDDTAADAMVLDPATVAAMLAAQGAKASSTSAAASAPTQPSSPQLKTRFKRRRALQPIFSGGSVAIEPTGQWMVTTFEQTAVVSSIASGRVVARVPGDTEDLTSLCLTPDGTHLVLASRSLGLRIFAATFPSSEAEAAAAEGASFDLVRTLARAHDAPVSVMAVDPTSTLLATGAADGAVKVWDIAGGYCTHVFRGHGGIVSSLAWNMPSHSAKGKERTGLQNEQRKIELFTGAIDGRVRLWDLQAKAQGGAHKPKAVLSAHVSVVRGLCVSLDGNMLVSGSRDKTLLVWRRKMAGKGKGANKTPGGSDETWVAGDPVVAAEGIEGAGFLKPDEDGAQDLFFTGGSEGELRLWRASTSRVESVQPGGRWMMGLAGRAQTDGDADPDETRAITECHYVPAIDAIVSVHADQNIVFRSATSGSSTSRPLTRLRQIVGFNDEVVDLAMLSPVAGERDTHLAVATNSTAIKVYDIRSDGQDVDMLPADAESGHGHTALILSLDKSPDGMWLASGAKDRTARIWARVAVRQSGANDATDVGQVVSKKDKKSRANGGGESVLQWRCVAVAEGHAESVGALAFARRSNITGAPFLVTASQDRTAKVWDLLPLSAALEKDNWDAGSPPLKLKSLTTLKIHDKDVNSLDVSPNNALLISASQDRTAKVWSLNYVPPSKANGGKPSAALKPVATCKGHKRSVWAVRFSPADPAFITASADRTARLWSLRDFSCVKTFEGHTNGVLRADFLGSKGMQLVTTASDGLVKLWNVKDESCVDTMDGHEERVWGLALRSDASEIISAGADSVITFWEDRTEQDQIEQAKEKEEMVEREQQFTNLLSLKDYHNAISLAITLDQPRRLLSLFSTVNAGRPDGDAARSASLLLESALGGGAHGTGLQTSASKALEAAGILPSRGDVKSLSLSDDVATGSITGSSAVDGVIARLGAYQLARMMQYIRDWNTSARTSVVAQLVLHAILRSRSAEDIIEAFEEARRSKAKRSVGMDVDGEGEDGEREREDDEPDMSRSAILKRKAEQRKKVPDLAAVIDGLLPYTERHYARADRLVTESAVLDYTLAQMDALLGPELEVEVEEEEEGREEEEEEVLDEEQQRALNGFVQMNEDEDGDEDKDEEMNSDVDEGSDDDAY